MKFKYITLINILTCICFLLLPYYLFGGKLFIGGDDTRLFYSYPYEFLRNVVYFSWINVSTIGYSGSQQYLLPFLCVWIILGKILNNAVVLSYFAFSLPMIGGFIYIQKFIRELFELKNENDFEIYLGGLCYVLSPIIIASQLFVFLTSVWLLIIVPSMGYYFLKYLRTSKFIYVYKAMLICLFLSLGLLAIPWFAGFMLPLVLGSGVLLYLSTGREIFTFLKRAFIFLLYICLSQTFWLLGFLAPYIVLDRASNAMKFASKIFLDTFLPSILATAKGYIIYPILNLFHRQIAIDFAWKLKDDFISFYDKTYFLNAVLIAFIILGLFLFKKHFNAKNRRTYLFIIISFLISLYFFTVNIGPLKDIFILAGKFPGFVIFRNFYDKFAPGYVFLYSILLAAGAVLVKKRFPNTFRVIELILLIVIVINYFPVKSIVNSELWTTKGIYKTLILPKEYLDFMKIIQKEVPSTNSIFSTPFGESIYSIVKEDNSKNVYLGISPVKIFSGVNDVSGLLSFNYAKESFTIADIILSRKYNELNKILYNYNINYVLLTNNIPNEVLHSYAFNGKMVEKQDAIFLEGITDKKLLTSEKGNYELYSTKKRNILIRSDNTTFQKISPVKYLVKINNISKPQVFFFNDNYQYNWKLYVRPVSNTPLCITAVFEEVSTKECQENFHYFDFEDLAYFFKKPIFHGSHTMTDGSTNQWVIDPSDIKNTYDKNFYTVNADGSINIELVMYFRSQAYFYYGLFISLGVLVISTGYVVYQKCRKHA